MPPSALSHSRRGHVYALTVDHTATFEGLPRSLPGLAYRMDVPVPVFYRGKALGSGYRVDLLVEGTIVLEMK